MDVGMESVVGVGMDVVMESVVEVAMESSGKVW